MSRAERDAILVDYEKLLCSCRLLAVHRLSIYSLFYKSSTTDQIKRSFRSVTKETVHVVF